MEKYNPKIENSNEAIDFVEKHRDFFEHYARGKVNFEPAPEGLKTFAYNLKTDTIYISPMFYKELGYSDEKTEFATLHETEHFLEKVSLLNEKGGEKVLESYLKRMQESGAFSIMDNCLADMRENRTVISKTNKAMGEVEQKCYKENLFQEKDFTKAPRHVQFCQAILRENRLPDEKCVVSEDVRKKLGELHSLKNKRGKEFLDILTDPNVPMSLRLKMQNEKIWPMVEELMEKDIEDEKKKKEEQEKTDNQKGENKDKKNQDGENNEDGRSESKSEKNGKKAKSDSKDKGQKTSEEKIDPNEIFKSAYEEAKKKTPEAVPLEDIKKALEEYKKEKGGDSLDKADEEYAKKLGVEKKDLQEYREIVKSLEDVVNKETGESVIEELKNLISKIIAKRTKPQMAPRYPLEEGEELVSPSELVSEVKKGNLEPKVWETHETKDKKGDIFGEVEITLVCDRSGSMQENNKANEQRRAAILFMEALKEFAEMCEEEKVNLIKPLEIRSEIYSFQDTSADKIPLKKMSSEIGEKERIDVARKLHNTSGGTTDFVTLETINSNLDEDLKKKMKEGEVKKIVVVFTDGESNDSSRVQNILGKLRKEGVVVVGIGITESGDSALVTYAPEARLAETAEKLPVVLTDVLKEHLKDI